VKKNFHQFTHLKTHKEKEMVDLRKWFPALAIVALLLGSAVTASAQPAFTFAVTAGVPPLVRAEGITELLGDIVLNCTGGNPAQQNSSGTALVPGMNVSVFLNTNVTSRLLNSSNDSEALLLVDEPNVNGRPLVPCVPPANQASCSVLASGAAGQTSDGVTPIGGVVFPNGYVVPGGVVYGGTSGGQTVPNAFIGRWGGTGSPNVVSWNGVPIDAPGTVGTRVIRITNLRGNASQLGVSSTLVPSQIVAFVSITSTQPLALSNPQQIIGFVTQGLRFSVQNPSPGRGRTLQQCVANNPNLAGDPSRAQQQGPTFRARFVEGFASSFKRRSATPGDLRSAGDGTVGSGVLFNCPGTCGTYSADALNTGSVAAQNTPGQSLFTESGFVPATGSPIGAADHGTRLMVRLTGIPTGTQIFFPLYEQGGTSANSRVRLISTDASGAGSGTPIVGTSTTSFPPTIVVAAGSVTGGAATAVYEVISSDPTIVEQIDIPITTAFASSAAGLGTANVIGSFAPISTVTVASQTAPIPRFIDTAASTGAFTINPCRTNLLFPFVTNQAGFDTGIAISNTSQDIFSASSDQSGPCRIHYFGGTAGGGPAPATQTSSAAVPAGGQLLFVTSSGGTLGIAGTPGFQGYVIAQCDFQYAHGFAFITDGPIGAARVAEGYLALVMDVPTIYRTENDGEALGN
jgi:hypothetical protein